VAIAGWHARFDPRPELVAAREQRLALAEAERAAQRLGQQVERRAGAQRVAATDPDRDLGVALPDPADELHAEP
jgi:hypothetical protein